MVSWTSEPSLGSQSLYEHCWTLCVPGVSEEEPGVSRNRPFTCRLATTNSNARCRGSGVGMNSEGTSGTDLVPNETVSAHPLPLANKTERQEARTEYP